MRTIQTSGRHSLTAELGALGPIATSARDLALFCRVMLQYKPWLVEPPLLEMPWKQDVVEGTDIPEKLSIAILWDDGVVLPHPPILHALKRVKDALVAAGHEVIAWQPVSHQEAWDLIVSVQVDVRCYRTFLSSACQCKLYFLDGGEEYRATLKNDPPVAQTQWIMSRVPNRGAPFSIADTFRLNLEREAFRAKIMHHWNATETRTTAGRPVDAIVAPVAPTLAPPHDTTRWWGYTSYWNLLDYPAAVFPVGRLDADDYRPMDLSAEVNLPKGPRNPTEEFVQAQWDPRTYHNASIGLQLIGRRLNEEKVLGMLRKVEEAVCCFR